MNYSTTDKSEEQKMSRNGDIFQTSDDSPQKLEQFIWSTIITPLDSTIRPLKHNFRIKRYFSLMWLN